MDESAEVALAAARGEAKGLLIACEMAERAWAALWQELRTQRADRADLEHGLKLLEQSLTDAKAVAAETARRLAEAEDSRAAAEAASLTAQARAHDADAALQTTRAELATVREDARGTAAQLADTQARLADTQAFLADTQAHLADTRARLAATLASHSWRITAPVRWLSTRLYRRS